MHCANKTRFHFEQAWGLHSSKSNLRGEAEHAEPEAPSQAHEAGSGTARARESLGGGKREGRNIPINLPESAQALALLTADIWRKKITLQVPPRLFQLRADGEEAEQKLRAQVQVVQKAKSIIFQDHSRDGDPTAAHKKESDTYRNSLKRYHRSLHSESFSKPCHFHFPRQKKIIFHIHP